MKHSRFLGRCYQILNNGDILIRNLKGEEYSTDKTELADMGRRYTYREIGEEFDVSYLTIWRIFRDAGIRKKYIRRTA